MPVAPIRRRRLSVQAANERARADVLRQVHAAAGNDEVRLCLRAVSLLIGMSMSWIRQAEADGKFVQAERLGTRVRFRAGDVRRWLASRATAGMGERA